MKMAPAVEIAKVLTLTLIVTATLTLSTVLANLRY